jgi:hypothetical protein
MPGINDQCNAHRIFPLLCVKTPYRLVGHLMMAAANDDGSGGAAAAMTIVADN